MDARYPDLVKRMSRQGWRVVERDRDCAEWWADEIWKVESEWAPRGFTLFLTWQKDEDLFDGVWAVGASDRRAGDHLSAGEVARMSVNHWPRDVPGFLAALSSARDARLAEINRASPSRS